MGSKPCVKRGAVGEEIETPKASRSEALKAVRSRRQRCRWGSGWGVPYQPTRRSGKLTGWPKPDFGAFWAWTFQKYYVLSITVTKIVFLKLLWQVKSFTSKNWSGPLVLLFARGSGCYDRKFFLKITCMIVHCGLFRLVLWINMKILQAGSTRRLHRYGVQSANTAWTRRCRRFTLNERLQFHINYVCDLSTSNTR